MFSDVNAARLIAVSALALTLTAGAAQAQQPTPDQLRAIKSNCRSDYMANCMSVRPGGPEALHCLQHHVAKLSGACKSAVDATLPPPPPPPAAAPPPPKAPAAPKPVVVAAPPPPAAPPPKAVAAPAPRPSTGAMAAIKAHCRSDYMAHCGSVTPGGKQALECIQHHYAELSPDCKTVVGATMPPSAAARKPVRKVKRAKATAVAPPPAAPPPAPVIPMAKIESLTLRQKILIIRACHYDQDAVCPSVPGGGGRIVACLAQHANALSLGCRRTLVGVLR
jgi:hypothetical protein